MEYNTDKWYDIMNTTQMNYANMIRRLTSQKKFGDTVLVYYSIALIVYSLTAEFYPEWFNGKMASYFGIIMSIVLLVYSLINGNAKYADRIMAAEQVLNKVKDFKRELSEDNVVKMKELYENVIDTAEYRDDLDFFRTLCQKAKEDGVKPLFYRSNIKNKLIKLGNAEDDKKKIERLKKLNNYFSEVMPLIQTIKIIINLVIKFTIIVAPIIIFLICYTKVFNVFMANII